MPKFEGDNRSQGLWSAILRDVHFWVPLIVLLGGLIALRWIR